MRNKIINFFISILIPPVLPVVGSIITGYLWFIYISQPRTYLESLKISYIPVFFTYIKISLLYVSYLWVPYIFAILVEQATKSVKQITKYLILHNLVIIIPSIILSYLWFQACINHQDTPLWFKHLSIIIALILSIYFIIAFIHIMYSVIKSMIRSRNPYLNITRLTILFKLSIALLFGFLISGTLGIIAIFVPELCTSRIFNILSWSLDLNRWTVYFIPSYIEILDYYFSTSIRLLFILLFFKRELRI